MKYKTLHHQARFIDHLIDHTLRSKRNPTQFLTQQELKTLILNNLANLYVIDQGWHKIVFGIPTVEHRIVLKVGTKKTIENDHQAYKRVPKSVRRRWFAKIFWHTKYCLLQEYGFSVNVSLAQLTLIRQTVYKYGIVDVKVENIRDIDGELKIIDANVTRIPLPYVFRKVDELKPKLPKRLSLLLKKISKSLYDR